MRFVRKKCLTSYLSANAPQTGEQHTTRPTITVYAESHPLRTALAHPLIARRAMRSTPPPCRSAAAHCALAPLQVAARLSHYRRAARHRHAFFRTFQHMPRNSGAVHKPDSSPPWLCILSDALEARWRAMCIFVCVHACMYVSTCLTHVCICLINLLPCMASVSHSLSAMWPSDALELRKPGGILCMFSCLSNAPFLNRGAIAGLHACMHVTTICPYVRTYVFTL